MISRDQARIGAKVRLVAPGYQIGRQQIGHVPMGTRGVIDDVYDTGVIVAWHQPRKGEPLPLGYWIWDHRAVDDKLNLRLTRDPFEFEDLIYLELVA